jgi:hypothetical protein
MPRLADSTPEDIIDAFSGGERLTDFLSQNDSPFLAQEQDAQLFYANVPPNIMTSQQSQDAEGLVNLHVSSFMALMMLFLCVCTIAAFHTDSLAGTGPLPTTAGEVALAAVPPAPDAGGALSVVKDAMHGAVSEELSGVSASATGKVMEMTKSPRQRKRWPSGLLAPACDAVSIPTIPPKVSSKTRRDRAATPEPPAAYKARKWYLASVGKKGRQECPEPYPFKSPRLWEEAQREVVRIVVAAAEAREAVTGTTSTGCIPKCGASGGA